MDETSQETSVILFTEIEDGTAGSVAPFFLVEPEETAGADSAEEDATSKDAAEDSDSQNKTGSSKTAEDSASPDGAENSGTTAEEESNAAGAAAAARPQEESSAPGDDKDDGEDAEPAADTDSAGTADAGLAQAPDTLAGETDTPASRRLRRAGTALMTLGTCLVAAALALFLYNRWDDRRAQQASLFVLEEIAAAGPVQTQEETEETQEETVWVIDDEAYVGILSIPSLGIELPVYSDWSYPKLKLSPCRYTGSAAEGDLVIAAHNYESHFGTLKTLVGGEDVIFADADGNVWYYTVAEVETLQPTAIEEMTQSGYPLTLFTCTYGGAARVTVRCEAAQE